MKKTIAILMTAVMVMANVTQAMAGTWVQNNADGRWQYANDDGSYKTGEWAWINGQSGNFCYYFDENGYMLADTTTPDGYTVNADGAWIENGRPVSKGPAAGVAATKAQNETNVSAGATPVQNVRRERMTYYTPETEAKMKVFWDELATKFETANPGEEFTVYFPNNLGMEASSLIHYAYARHFLGYAPKSADFAFYNAGNNWKIVAKTTDRNKQLNATDRAVKEWVKNKISGKEPTIETLKWFYTELGSIRYDHNDSETTNGAYGIITEGATKCPGFTKVMMYAAELLGMESYFVSGTLNGKDHAWCVVVYNGETYAIDPTGASSGDPLSKKFVKSDNYMIPGDVVYAMNRQFDGLY